MHSFANSYYYIKSTMKIPPDSQLQYTCNHCHFDTCCHVKVFINLNPIILYDIKPQIVIKRRGRAVKSADLPYMECWAWVRYPLETYIFRLNFCSLSVPNSSADSMQMKLSMIIHLWLLLYKPQIRLIIQGLCVYIAAV